MSYDRNIKNSLPLYSNGSINDSIPVNLNYSNPVGSNKNIPYQQPSMYSINLYTSKQRLYQSLYTRNSQQQASYPGGESQQRLYPGLYVSKQTLYPEMHYQQRANPYYANQNIYHSYMNHNKNLEKKDDSNEEEVAFKEKKKENMIPFLQLFKFATPVDKIMMIIGSIGAIANGVILPLVLIIFSNMIDGFVYNSPCDTVASTTSSVSSNITTTTVDYKKQLSDKLTSGIRDQVIYLIILAIGTTILSYFQVGFWIMTAERQTRAIRVRLFESILRQDIGWFDIYKSGELNNRLTDDVDKIKDGLSDKFANSLQFTSTFFSGIIIGFIKGWKLSLVVLSLAPLLFIVSIGFAKVASYLTSNELKAYAKAGAVADEVFTAIRTVFAFNGAKKDHLRYEARLDDARRLGIRKSVINGLLLGFIWLVINGGYALGFWYGWKLTIDEKDNYKVGTVIIVFFSIIIGVFSLGNAAPYFATLTTARTAAYEVFDIIKRVPSIDIESNEGEIPRFIYGDIKFRNVNFRYPSRPETQILNNLSLNIRPGSTVAFVGSSGCGKSTCIQLLQRFYDPLEGNLLIDNKDVRSLNLNWWRTRIGVVNQEPILFATTIAENIRMGKEDATEQEIIKAAINANAHDFIMKLPDRYETLVGNRGSQLSGGQKQRIAIARALIRDPKILLLDEATSALDNESEGIVQKALDKARQGRTTIVIAHRLSTIRNADTIYAMDKGRVVEAGTHDQLMSKKGVYHKLVISQQSAQDNVLNTNNMCKY